MEGGHALRETDYFSFEWVEVGKADLKLRGYGIMAGIYGSFI
jgi:hypothetical protein